MDNTVKDVIFKNIGFFNHTNSLKNKIIENGFLKFMPDDQTQNFLKNSYYTEYVSILFSEISGYSVDRYSKKIDLDFEIITSSTKVRVDYFEVFFFNDPYQKNQTAIFSLNYIIDNPTLEMISDISNFTKNNDCMIRFKDQDTSLKEFIASNFLSGYNYYDNDTSLEQYAGSKFKNYLILDFEKEDLNRDNLLFELGTSSKLNTINDKTIDAPSEAYMNNILQNKISCFRNYDCLTLLTSFTVIGSNNYNRDDIHNHSTWNNIYFCIYIYNLYLKSSLQIFSNDFTEESMKKRNEFQEFYNKYYLKKISYNFLPNEIYKGIYNSLEIEEDINFIRDRLETLAIQVNEKQQNQIGLILLVISVIALLETPLHIEGIREIIGIDAVVIYNTSVYFLLVFSVLFFLYKNLKK